MTTEGNHTAGTKALDVESKDLSHVPFPSGTWNKAFPVLEPFYLTDKMEMIIYTLPSLDGHTY